jgi:hypothetical protein
MNVRLRNNGSQADTWELIDDVAQQHLPNVTILPDTYIVKPFAASPAGYANFRARRLGNVTWTLYELVSEGQEKILD